MMIRNELIDVIKHLQMILAQLLQGVFHSFGGAEAKEVWSLLKKKYNCVGGGSLLETCFKVTYNSLIRKLF